MQCGCCFTEYADLLCECKSCEMTPTQFLFVISVIHSFCKMDFHEICGRFAREQSIIGVLTPSILGEMNRAETTADIRVLLNFGVTSFGTQCSLVASV